MRCHVLFILRSRLLLYYAWSGVNREPVVLSGFSVILFRFVQAKSVCSYCFICFLATLVLVCVDVMMISSKYAMTWTGALGSKPVCS